MKTIPRLVAMMLALVLFPLAAPVFGQAPEAAATPPAVLKIRFINLSMVLRGTEEAKVGFSGINSFFDEKKKQYEAKSAELDKLKQQFQQQGPSLNPQTATEMQRSIADQEKALRRFEEDSQAEIQQKQNALLERLTDKIQPILSEYAKQNQLSAIFYSDTIGQSPIGFAQPQGFFDPSLDVTQEIISLYNQKNPGPAPATPPPSQD